MSANELVRIHVGRPDLLLAYLSEPVDVLVVDLDDDVTGCADQILPMWPKVASRMLVVHRAWQDHRAVVARAAGPLVTTGLVSLRPRRIRAGVEDTGCLIHCFGSGIPVSQDRSFTLLNHTVHTGRRREEDVKPTVVRHLLEHVVSPREHLLDPFAGDGLWGLVAIQLGRRVTALVRNDIQHDGLQIAAADRCLFASDQIKSGEVPVSNTELDSDDDW